LPLGNSPPNSGDAVQELMLLNIGDRVQRRNVLIAKVMLLLKSDSMDFGCNDTVMTRYKARLCL